jgi:hypothetical protein
MASPSTVHPAVSRFAPPVGVLVAAVPVPVAPVPVAPVPVALLLSLDEPL